MDEHLKRVQALLDATARECLRYLCSHDLKPEHARKLAQFMFGCMNQKFELPRRYARHGAGEFDKILRFIARAADVLVEIDSLSEIEREE